MEIFQSMFLPKLLKKSPKKKTIKFKYFGILFIQSLIYLIILLYILLYNIYLFTYTPVYNV